MGSVRIMNKHFSFWIKFHTWKKVFSWRLFKENPSRKLKCQSKTFFLHEESISHNSNVIQNPSLFLLLHLLSLPSCRRYCFPLYDRWLFQIVYDVNGPISTTISMTMEYICCFFSSSLLCRCIRFLITIWGVLSHSRHSKETKMIQQTLRLWPFWMFKMRSFVINALNLDESNESKSYEKEIILDCMYK